MVKIMQEIQAENQAENQDKNFDYDKHFGEDEGTKEYLKNVKCEIYRTGESTLAIWGDLLIRAQEKLSKHGYGCFREWIEKELPFGHKKAYQLINERKLIVSNGDKRELLDSMQPSLKKEIAKTNANEELKQKVLDGEIETLKEYKLREEKLKKELFDEKDKREKAEQKAIELANKPPKTIEVEKTVEVYIQDDLEVKRLQNELESFKSIYNNLENEKKSLEKKIDSVEKNAEEYQKLKKDLDNLRDRKNDVIKQIDNAGTIGRFIARVDESFEKDLAPIKYSRAIEELHRSEPVMNALNGIVSKVENWCKEIRSIMPKENYINMEVIDFDNQQR
jgi:chromosome segregation ATPase